MRARLASAPISDRKYPNIVLSVPTNPHKRTPNAAFAYQVSSREDVELMVRLLRLTHQRFCQGNRSMTSNHSFDSIALNRFLDPKRVFHPRVKALTAHNCTTLQGCADALIARPFNGPATELRSSARPVLARKLAPCNIDRGRAIILLLDA
jgi:hypothetical protein